MEDKCNNPPFRGILKKGGIKDCMINHPKRRIIDTILHISGYLHTFTFLSVVPFELFVMTLVHGMFLEVILPSQC